MIVIDNVLISDDVIEKKFVCDLSRCKGACCEDGDAGAPLEESEISILEDYIDEVKPYMVEEGIRVAKAVDAEAGLFRGEEK